MEALGVGEAEEGVAVVPVLGFGVEEVDFADELVGVNGNFVGVVGEGIFAADRDLERAVCGVEIDVEGIEEERFRLLSFW